MAQVALVTAIFWVCLYAVWNAFKVVPAMLLGGQVSSFLCPVPNKGLLRPLPCERHKLSFVFHAPKGGRNRLLIVFCLHQCLAIAATASPNHGTLPPVGEARHPGPDGHMNSKNKLHVYGSPEKTGCPVWPKFLASPASFLQKCSALTTVGDFMGLRLVL